MPEKDGAHSQRNIHADVQIQWKPGRNNTEITGLHRCSSQNLPPISRASPIGKYLWVNISDLYNGGRKGGEREKWIITTFTTKRNTNEIKRNDSTFYEIYTFYFKTMHSWCNCANNLILSSYPIQPTRSHCSKHDTPILFPSCRVWTICFINQSYTAIL